MEKTLEQRVEELEKRVAELEGRVPEQPNTIEKINNFTQLIGDIPKDDFGKVKNKPRLKKPLLKTKS